jgi:hypothetical protein
MNVKDRHAIGREIKAKIRKRLASIDAWLEPGDFADQEISWRRPMNPHGYKLDQYGQPVCSVCREVTNRAYRKVPELRCWNCGAPMPRSWWSKLRKLFKRK